MSDVELMRRRSGKSVVQVHDEDVLASIVNEGQKAQAEIERRFKKSKQIPKKDDSVESPCKGTFSGEIADSRSVLNQSVRAKDWLNEKTIKKLQDRTDKESQAAKKLYAPLLETEATFVKDVSDYLAHKDLVDLRKKEVLHKRWSDQVYEPIRRKVLEAMDGTEWDHLDRRKREMHRQFLEHVNKRGYVFLEDDDRAEYYAQALNGHRPAPIKIRTEALNDPLLTLGKLRSAEDRVVMRCETGNRYRDADLDQVQLPPLPLVPLGRHGVDSIRWLEMPLNNIDSHARERSRRRMLGLATKCEVDFGEWAKTGFEPKTVERELQIPRRKCYEEVPPYGRPPAEVARGPFIDPDNSADKIINTNPFPEHLATLKLEYEEAQNWFQQRQQEENNLLNQEQQAQPMLAQA